MADIFQEEFHSTEDFHEVEDLVFSSKDSSGHNEQDKQEQNGTENDDDEEEGEFVNIHDDSSSAEPQCSEPSLAELANSHFIHIRQTATKQLLDFITAARSNKDELLLSVSIMCKLADDEEPMVRAELMGQIPQIAKFCWENGDDLKKVIRQQLVPITVKLINDEQSRVMKAAHAALLSLLEQKVIDESQLSEWLCPLIAQLAGSDTEVHNQIAAINVMCKMASLVGKDLAIKFFLDPFSSLCDSKYHHVLEECLLNFVEFCRALGPVVTEVALLPKFLACCTVSSVPLRISCIEIFADVSRLVSPKSREILADYYIRVLEDNISDRAIDIAVRNLGIFITSFADPQKTGLCYDNGTWIAIPQNTEKIETNNSGHQLHIDDTKTSIDHCDDDASDSSNHQLDDGPVSSNHQQDDGPVSSNHQQDDGPVSSNHQQDDGPVSSNHTQQDSIISNRQDDTDINSHPQDGSSTESCVNSHRNDVDVDKITFDSTNDDSVSSQDERQCFYNRKKLRIKARLKRQKIFSKLSRKSDDLSYGDDYSTKQMNGCEGEEKKFIVEHQQTVFNNFQFWRLPLPEVDLGIEVDGKSSNSPVSSEVLDNIKNLSQQEAEGEKREPLSDSEVRWRISDRESRLHDHNFGTCDVNRDDLEEESKFSQDIVPPVLLQKYFEMLDSVDNSSNYESDVELAKCCAYSLLGVVYTLGRKFWPHLKPMVVFLSSHVQWSVRKTVASYLNKLAVIVGPENAASDLMPIFVDLVKDLDEVRSALLMNLAEFLSPLPASERRVFLPYLEEFLKMDNENNWRLRHALAQQMIPCAPLYEPSEVWEYFFPVASQLIRDRIAVVRREASLLMAAILKCLRAKEGLQFSDQLLEEILTLRGAQKWHLRQTFVLVCEQIAANNSLPRKEYLDQVLPLLLPLASDTVANIRMAVARCIQSTLIPKGYLSNIDQISHNELLNLIKVLFCLKRDVDKDVRFFALLIEEIST